MAAGDLMNDDVRTVIERRDQSRRYMVDNFYGEWTEVFRALKCRTKPIWKKDDAGQDIVGTIDDTKTNVAMPEMSVAWRKNVARMIGQPYRLRYEGGSDPRIAESLSALALKQYKASGEQVEDRRLVMFTEGLGVGYGKLYWDTFERTMDFRRAFVRNNQVVFRDRASVMRAQGAGEDEIADAVGQLGPDLSDSEVQSFIGKGGNEITVPTQVTKYDGPCVRAPFPGDIFIEPGSLLLDRSDWVIEQYRESDLWLKKMCNVTYKDPETGEQKKAFDPKACQELLDLDPDPDETRQDDLKRMFEDAIGRSRTDQYKNRLLRTRRRFDILEQHAPDDNGVMWITYVSERYRDRPLGKMPYPWNFYGKTAYTEFIALPDMISAVGDATPRLMRFLHAMHNMTVAQNFDYIRNLLKRLVLVKQGVDIDEDVQFRGDWRQLTVPDLNVVKVLDEPSLPPGALEREAQILREEAALEPSLNTVDTGTASNPMAGKLATTAMLNAKASDTLLAFKIAGRDIYLRDLGQKKLWMNQQAAEDPWTIEAKYFPPELAKMAQEAQASGQPPEWVMTDRNGKTVAVKLDPLDIQEDLDVEPEAGSYLAVDDELNQAKIMQVQQIAMANPGTIDPRKLARLALTHVRGVGNPDDLLMPEPQGPQPPEPRVNISITAKFEELPPALQAKVAEELLGQPVDENDVAAAQQLHNVKLMGDAADAAANLVQPAVQPPAPEGAVGSGRKGLKK